MIVGLAGKKGSGKSTAALALLNADFELMSFAYTLKLMARILMSDCGLTNGQIQHAQAHKEEVMPVIGTSYRVLCQTLGTEWGRQHVHPDLWVIAARHRASRAIGDVVFDDVRFENEARMIRDAGGIIIHIHRDLPGHDDHESENGIEFVEGDYSISNLGDIDHLHDTVLSIVDAVVTK